MPRQTPLLMGALIVLLAACGGAAVDRTTATASLPATPGPSAEPGSSSLSPSPAATVAPDPLPSPPTDVTASSNGPGKPGTTFTVHLAWTQAAPTDAYRIYEYQTGEGPGYGRCVLDKTKAWSLMETQPGATSADVSMDSAVTGAGVRCLFVVAVNAAGESSPTLAWHD